MLVLTLKCLNETSIYGVGRLQYTYYNVMCICQKLKIKIKNVGYAYIFTSDIITVLLIIKFDSINCYVEILDFKTEVKLQNRVFVYSKVRCSAVINYRLKLISIPTKKYRQ